MFPLLLDLHSEYKSHPYLR